MGHPSVQRGARESHLVPDISIKIALSAVAGDRPPSPACRGPPAGPWATHTHPRCSMQQRGPAACTRGVHHLPPKETLRHFPFSHQETFLIRGVTPPSKLVILTIFDLRFCTDVVRNITMWETKFYNFWNFILFNTIFLMKKLQKIVIKKIQVQTLSNLV